MSRKPLAGGYSAAGKADLCLLSLREEAGLCHLLDTPWGVVGSCYGNGAFFMSSHGLKRVLRRRRGGADGHAHWAALWREGLLCFQHTGQISSFRRTANQLLSAHDLALPGAAWVLPLQN